MASISAVRVFASHDWGVNGQNHKKVMQLCKILDGSEGIQVWYDEKDMKSDILTSMCKGIDECHVVLIFITENYIRKVAEGGESDNVRREFMYSVLKKKVMIPIRMEKVESERWTGPVGMQLGSILYMDFPLDCNDPDFLASLRRRINSASSRTRFLSAGRKTSVKNAFAREFTQLSHRPPPSLPQSLYNRPRKEEIPALCKTTSNITLKERFRKAQMSLGHVSCEDSTSADQLDKLLLSVVGEKGARQLQSLSFIEKLETVESNVFQSSC